MASNRTIAELAERKAELLNELDELNAEIKSGAGERDDDRDKVDEFDHEPEFEDAAAFETVPDSTELATATDKSAEDAENTSATT